MEHFNCIKALLIIKKFFTLKTVLLKSIHLNVWNLVSVIEWKKLASGDFLSRISDFFRVHNSDIFPHNLSVYNSQL